jgi:hypothetical protein
MEPVVAALTDVMARTSRMGMRRLVFQRIFFKGTPRGYVALLGAAYYWYWWGRYRGQRSGRVGEVIFPKITTER